MSVEFQSFPKIPRLKRHCIITEKIDGTNACIRITEDGQFLTGSRNRWITPDDDNFGFSRWAHANREELIQGLGEGTHFGEWWGAGIQRTYGLKEKRFSLFNTHRWKDGAPACCHVVPILHIGLFNTDEVETCISTLKAYGSAAEHGFMNPEGVVVFHAASGKLFKVTCEGDGQPKGK